MRVVIVGGVAAGMSAAARLRRLDEQAEIIVLEKDEHVSFANCGLPYHIGGAIPQRQNLLVQTPESLKASLNLDVRVFSEVVGIDPAGRSVEVREVKTGRVYRESYDALVLATGAKPIRPPMPGLDHPAVFELRNIADMDRILTRIDAGAKRAVVMGGYIGIEAAENLRHRGLEVILVEKMPQLMGPLDPEMAFFLQAELERNGVAVMTGCGVSRFRDQGGRVVVGLESGAELEADLVVFALGSTPNSGLAGAAGVQLGPRGAILVDAGMRTSVPGIYAAGDSVQTVDVVTGQPAYVPLAGPANRQGRIAADSIAGRDSAYRGTRGTSVLKVFDQTVAMTGANEKALKAANLPYRKVYLHPFGHASYYPGTAQMHAKLLFSEDGRRIYGCQIVGADGVDKRIDVIATAMAGNLGVWDLEHLEMAYAPPYGSAKDPVNMAGFLACNLLRGDVAFWYAEEFGSLPSHAVILDVRTPAEFEAWHVPGSVNVPLAALRRKLDDLDRSKRYYIYCKVGLRSYLAYRIMTQRGFDVLTLAGGTDMFKATHSTVPAPASRAPAPASCGATDCGAPAAAASPRCVSLDCTGLQCPGPIARLAEAMGPLAIGEVLHVRATDPGFLQDAQAWCTSRGHAFLEGRSDGGKVEATIRKEGSVPSAGPAVGAQRLARKTMVVFSGDLDKVLAALVIANGAVAMGDEVTLFFTFWGLTALRKPGVTASRKPILDRMFGMMLPAGVGQLKLSRMHMAGMGTAMMKYVMKSKRVESAHQLLLQARAAGVRLVACSMSLDVMGLRPEELIEGVEVGGVATFLAEADRSSATLFV